MSFAKLLTFGAVLPELHLAAMPGRRWLMAVAKVNMLDSIKQWIRARLDRNSFPYRCLRALNRPHETVKNLRHSLTKSSIFFDESEMSNCSLLPEALLESVITRLNPQSILDVGCGTGRSLDYFLDRGIEAQGVEGSALGISKAKHPGRILNWNLNKELNLRRKFDLVWCFEVAEHIHPDYVESLLKTLTNHSGTIVMSAAHPGQGGIGHFNEQPRQYWLVAFAKYGYHHNDELKRELCENWTWYPENIFVFQNSATSGEKSKA
jgi:2-polyprenyl-3-methyl-5-hydroxy-6-metoxy-1,4-benzoquinol methylase